MASRLTSCRVVLVGRPNAGKSSLFNALAGGQAMVSDQPGTTRDYLTARLDFGGVACELVDTAGVTCGRRRAHAHRPSSSRAIKPSGPKSRSCASTAAHRPTPAGVSCCRHPTGGQIVVLTKHDLSRSPDDQLAADLFRLDAAPVQTSVRTGHGLDLLRLRIAEAALSVAVGDGSSVAATAARAAHSVREAADALARRRSSTISTRAKS